MKIVPIIASLACACTLQQLALAGDGNPKLALAVGTEYTTGDYGGDQDIEDFYVPVKAIADIGRVQFRLTVPWLSVSAPEGTIITGPGGEPIPGPGVMTTNSGLGDVVASATVRDVFSNRRLGLAMDLTGKVKFGTADESQGLGTGENDFAVQADLLKFAGSATFIGSLGYTFRGDPADFDLEDTLLASLGGTYAFARDVRGGLFFDYRESSIGNDPIEELSAFVSRRFNDDWRLQFYVLTGFTDSGPQWGAGLQLKRTL